MVFFRSLGPYKDESNQPIAFTRGSHKACDVVTFPKSRPSIFYPKGAERVETEHMERVRADYRRGNGRDAGRETEGGFDATTEI